MTNKIDTSSKRKKHEQEVDFDEAYEKRDNKVSSLFKLNDNVSEDSNKDHFKRIRQVSQKDVKEYLWENHSLIVTDTKGVNLKKEKIVVGIGINPKKVTGGFEKANFALEATRRNGINAYNNLKNRKCKYYLQFDLTGESTLNSKNVKMVSNSSLETLRMGLNQFSSRIDCIEIAWGQDGQKLLNRAPKTKQELKRLLLPYMEKGLLYQFDYKKQFYPSHFANTRSKKKLVKLTDIDFKTYLE